jgi:hypothetical protein
MKAFLFGLLIAHIPFACLYIGGTTLVRAPHWGFGYFITWILFGTGIAFYNEFIQKKK